MDRLNIEFPAIQIFSDGGVKIIKSFDDLHGDADWVGANYDDNEFLIDSKASCYKLARHDKTSQMISLLMQSDILHPCDNEIDQIESTLHRAIAQADLDELPVVKTIIWKLKHRNNPNK